jgi:hypothetical protein
MLSSYKKKSKSSVKPLKESKKKTSQDVAVKGKTFVKSSKQKGKMKVVFNHPGLKKFLKMGKDSKDTLDEESYSAGLQMAASLMDPGCIYKFQIATYGSLTSSVAGLIATSIVNDPSAWSEWSSLSILFSQCRLRKASLYLMNAGNKAIGTTASNGNWQPTIFNALYDEVAAPTSYDATCDSPNFKVYNHNFDTSRSGTVIHLSFTGERTPLWGDVSAPHSSTAFSGTPGCFQVYADGQTVSTVMLTYVQVLQIEFMNRF